MSRAMVLMALFCLPGPARAETIADCEKIDKLRGRAACLLKTEQEQAIAQLHTLALEMYDKDYIRQKDGHLGIGGRQDMLYAAENAGVIAGKTSEAQLYKLLGQKTTWSQIFALRALSHMLSILRMGYAKGGDADKTRLEAVGPKVAKACARLFRSREGEVVEEAAKCVGQTRDNRHAAALVGLLVKAPSSKVQRSVFGALRNLSQLSAQVRALRPLVKVLLRPMPKKWSSDDVWIRGDICGLLSLHANHGDTWAKKPADAALKAIGDRNSQAKQKCQRLLNRI